MQLDRNRIVIRERGWLDLLDLALRVSRVYAWPLLPALAVGILPAMLLNAWLLREIAEPEFNQSVPFAYLWWMLILVLFEMPLATALATLYLGEAVFQDQPRLRSLVGGHPNFQLMQLTESEETPADRAAAGDMRGWAERLKTKEGLAEIAEYADWIAPYARDLIPRGPDDRLAAPTGLIERAHEAGLLVCAWTFRPENKFLPLDFRNGAGENARNPEGSVSEIRRYVEAGVDAFFADDPALGRRAVDGGTRPAPGAPG